MKSKTALVLISVMLSLVLAELALRYIHANPNSRYIWQPDLSAVFKPDSNIFIGIKGIKHFSINSQGARGRTFDNQSKNYLCVGGSTTECLYLDNTETWPKLLGDCLLQQNAKVASVGKSGCTSVENYLHIKYFVPQLKTVSDVILMCGLNDLMQSLSKGTSIIVNDSIEQAMLQEIFIEKEKAKTGWRKFELLTLLKSVLSPSSKTENWKIQDSKGTVYNKWRNYRTTSKHIIDTVPDLSEALNNFEKNLELIYAETQKQKVKLTIVNQATLYKDSMNHFEEHLLWMGGVGDFQKSSGHSYYSTKVLREATDLYNNRLMLFCNKHNNITFVDIASVLPKDTSVFYDDCHFNQSGANKVAEVICAELK